MKAHGLMLVAILSIADCVAAPGTSMRPTVVALQDFEIELVENPRTLKKAGLLAGGATDITGFAKVRFTVDDVGKWTT